MAVWRRSADLKKRADWLAGQSFVVLAIQVPKDNDKGPQSAEQFFSALHGIYRKDPVVQEYLSFELVAEKDSILFYIFTPLHLREFVEGQLYAQYPDLEIRQVPDYTSEIELEGLHVVSTKMQLTKEDVYPIKTYAGLDIDPLAGITAAMGKLQPNERIWFQMLIRPVGDEWQNVGVSYVQALRAGKDPKGPKKTPFTRGAHILSRFIKEAMNPGSGSEDSKSDKAEAPKLSAPQEAALKAVESKVTKLGFETVFRMLVISTDDVAAKQRSKDLLAAYKQFNTTNLNGFEGKDERADDFRSWEQFTLREFEEKGNILNIEELASVYHFPTTSVETNAISWAGSKKSEAPYNLPLKGAVDPAILTVLGRTDFRDSAREFGIKLDDRMRHIYVIGKSGTGKSTLLENMVIDDIYEGRGVIVVDPHGELADKVMSAIPENRIKDVIVFDPADRDFPIAFNILDITHEDQKGNIASGFVAGLKKIFGNSWGPRLEYILRNATLAILDTEHPTMLGIPRMLTDASFRNQVIPQIKDPVVLDFWKTEWASKDQKQQVEEMGSILNKVGQFLSTSLIRNIVGQPRSGFDMRRVMDEQKILIVNLSKGKIGEDNSALLGTMMITKVQLAAMSRADVDPSQRPPCFLYVDEFQNFATESFATILSEARKYNLGLTIAHQYIAQMSPEVKDAVFGNVGTILSFRVGSEDAMALKPEFAPIFDEGDLVNLQRGYVYLKLLIDGLAMKAFSAQTMPPRQIATSCRDQVVEYSRSHYARGRAEAEELIDETAGYKQRRENEQAKNLAAQILQTGRPEQGSGGGSSNHRPTSGYNQPAAQTPRPQQSAQPAPDRAFSTPVAASTPVAPVAAAPVVQAAPPPAPVVAQPVPVAAPLVPLVTEPVENLVPQIIEPAPALPVAVVEAEYLPAIVVEEGSVAPSPRPSREKPLKVLNGWAYKEVSQRGGFRWYLGEPEQEVLARRQAKKDLLAEKKALGDSPLVSSPLSEQSTNIESFAEAPQIAGETPQQPMREPVGVAPVGIALREGESINLQI